MYYVIPSNLVAVGNISVKVRRPCLANASVDLQFIGFVLFDEFVLKTEKI